MRRYDEDFGFQRIMTKKNRHRITASRLDYEEWRKKLFSDPEFRSIYKREAFKKELWLSSFVKKKTK